MWAYCYRVGLGINTNMIVEAFHRVFKYNYLKGKVQQEGRQLLAELTKIFKGQIL